MTQPEQSDSRERGPLYRPSEDAEPHATWDRYGHVRVHVGRFSHYLTPLQAAALAEALEDCANQASDHWASAGGRR